MWGLLHLKLNKKQQHRNNTTEFNVQEKVKINWIKSSLGHFQCWSSGSAPTSIVDECL